MTMGLFSKLKNSLTGGWAKVFVDCPGGLKCEEIPVNIRVVVGDNAIDVDRVYLKVRSREDINIPNYRVRDKDTAGDVDYHNVRAMETTYENEVTVAGAQSMDANGEYSFEGSFAVPENTSGTYLGKYARHVWEIFVGLDMKGNDPDSGWQEINIS
jgi:hypothetical protein